MSEKTAISSEEEKPSSTTTGEQEASTSAKQSEVDGNAPAGKDMNPQQIVEGFRKLRDEQQFLLTKVAELETERKEHLLVVDTLDSVEKDRKCYRLIGGVLVERTVNEVLPALKDNVEKLAKYIETFNGNLVRKSEEINRYRERHNIRFMNEMDIQQSKNDDTNDKRKDGAGKIPQQKFSAEQSHNNKKSSDEKTAGVLVG